MSNPRWAVDRVHGRRFVRQRYKLWVDSKLSLSENIPFHVHYLADREIDTMIIQAMHEVGHVVPAATSHSNTGRVARHMNVIKRGQSGELDILPYTLIHPPPGFDVAGLRVGTAQFCMCMDCRTLETVVDKGDRMVDFPLHTFHHVYLESLSIRGRGTTVSSMLDLSDGKKVALKRAWQDPERVANQLALLKISEQTKLPFDIIVRLYTLDVTRNGKTRTASNAIRGFLDDDFSNLYIENRVLTISITNLKRPVTYFWSLHDFIRGLRGALSGHKYLTSIGILHRDICESNITLGVYPWEETGCLTDFGMSIAQEAEEPTVILESPAEFDLFMKTLRHSFNQFARAPHEMGVFPYASSNVLLGKRETHFDDLASFFYVLLVFFFLYAGPLPKEEIEDAYKHGFAGTGRISHMRTLPEAYPVWADGDPKFIGQLKELEFWYHDAAKDLVEGDELGDCLQNNWPEVLHHPIRCLLLWVFTAFRKSVKETGGRIEPTHDEFIKLLDEWLVAYADLEDKSNCPDFKDPWMTD